MTARLSLVTLKQYRFELGFALFATVLAMALGLSIHVRMEALGVPPGCPEQVRASEDGSGIEAECARLVGAASTILGESYLNSGGTVQASIMGLLPFAVGLIAGLPIVARELEDRTAQTAWWLNPSRGRWLRQRLAPVVLALAVATGAAAVVASLVADDWLRWYGPEQSRIVGTHGPLVVLRTFAAFGIGLAAGALLGRTFSAALASVALLFLLLIGAAQVRDAYLAQLPLEPLWERSATGEWESVGGVPQAVAWGGSNGEILTSAQARQLATDAGVPPTAPDEPYDTLAETWLQEHGYVEISLGTTDRGAASWGIYDGLLFATVGGAGLAATFLIVGRRRPFA
jgi:hypothetical protein